MDKKIRETIAKYLPNLIGYSSSLFQDCGISTKHYPSAVLEDEIDEENPTGTNNWDKWINKKHIRDLPPGKELSSHFFVNYLDHPKDFATFLAQLGINCFRLSLERSYIQKNPTSTYNEEAIKNYKTLIQELKKNGIETTLTLNHFTLPEWFERDGGFENCENCENFVQFALDMMEIFEEIEYWMTFNEPSIYVMQTYIRKVYPHNPNASITMAGEVLKNILLTHATIYKRAKAKYKDTKQIGLTHQWLKFVPANPNNPLEQIICKILSHIAYEAVYKFFIPDANNSHKFTFSIPFLCNTHLTIDDEEKTGLLDFMGVQNYGFVSMKIGQNDGPPFPGNTINWTISPLNFGLTAGATCLKGGYVSSFGPPYDPGALIVSLIEAAKTGKPLMITETGIDRRMSNIKGHIIEDENLQARGYLAIAIIAALTNKNIEEEDKELFITELKKLLIPAHPSLEKQIEELAKTQIDLIALLYWTLLSRQLEWENGNTVHLGALKNVTVNPEGKIIDFAHSPASVLFKELCKITESEIAL